MNPTSTFLALVFVVMPLSRAEEEKEKTDTPLAKITVSGGLGGCTIVTKDEFKDGKLQSYKATTIKITELATVVITVRGSLSTDDTIKLLPGVTAEGVVRLDGKIIASDGTVRGRNEKKKDKNLAKGQAIVEGELVNGGKVLAIANGEWPITITGDEAAKRAEVRGKVRVTGKLRLTEKGGLEVVAEKVEVVKEKKER